MEINRRFAIPNTLALPAQAVWGCRAESMEDVKAAIVAARQKDLAFTPVGEGSNLVPQVNVEQFVCVLACKGIELLNEQQGAVRVQVAAGENWHGLVKHSLHRGWYGLENLALIPGSVGAAPVQNIGAYGVEVARFIDSVNVLDDDGRLCALQARECHFSYRDSLFKRRRGYTIVSVVFRLPTTSCVVTEYPELRQALTQRGIEPRSAAPAEVFDAIITLRQRKLPDPAQHPNAGSFFKNPVVALNQALRLQQAYPQLNTYPVADESDEMVKMSAAQLIDLAGWKEKPAAHVACWHNQPLVLVNTGDATGREILDFATGIQRDISRLYGVQLELEPSVLS